VERKIRRLTEFSMPAPEQPGDGGDDEGTAPPAIVRAVSDTVLTTAAWKHYVLASLRLVVGLGHPFLFLFETHLFCKENPHAHALLDDGRIRCRFGL
jgi:hypothetical protein